MRGLQVWVAVALVAVLAFSNSGVSTAQQTFPITQSIAKGYVDNLLNTYNADFTAKYGLNPSPNFTKNFKLYQPYGYSFNVTAMTWFPTSNSTVFIGFIFRPIVGFSPTVNIDSASYLQQILFPQFPTYFARPQPDNDLGFAIRQGAYNGTFGAGYSPFMLIANLTTLIANPSQSSAQEANFLFRNDQGAVTPSKGIGITIPSPPAGVSDWVNLVASALALVIFAGVAIGYWRNKRIREGINKWLHGG